MANLNPPSTGDPIKAALLQEVVGRLAALEVSSGPGMSTGRGGFNARETRRDQCRYMKIVAIHNNWLQCKHYQDTQASPTLYNVARPALNRRDSPEGGSVAAGGTSGTRVVNSVTYTFTYTGAQTRTVAGGTISGSESQLIGPTAYVVNDVILVAPAFLAVNDDSSGVVNCTYASLDARCWGTVPS